MASSWSFSCARSVMAVVMVVALVAAAVHAQTLIRTGPSLTPIPASTAKKDMIRGEADKMYARWRILDAQCDTNAIFAFTYWYMTTALDTNIRANYFDDNGLMADFTMTFAGRYNQAFEAWNTSGTPTLPWQETFAYGASGYSSCIENLVLGMNAHINYDLSQVVYTLNYGTLNRKADYNRINDILQDMTGPVTTDITARYDDSFAALTPFNPAILQLLLTWREGAWQNGVLLMAAPTAAARATILASITLEAMTIAHTQESYGLGFSTDATRDAFCNAHRH